MDGCCWFSFDVPSCNLDLTMSVRWKLASLGTDDSVYWFIPWCYWPCGAAFQGLSESWANAMVQDNLDMSILANSVQFFGV